MNICIVVDYLPPHYGGASVAGYRYFQHLKTSGKHIMLLGNHDKGVKKEEGIQLLPRARYNIHRYINYHLNFFLTSIYVFFFFLRKRKQFDVVHCFDAYSDIAFASCLMSFFFRKRSILESSLVGSDDPDSILAPAVHWFYLFIRGHYVKRWIYRRVTAHVSKSRYMSTHFNAYTSTLKNMAEIPYFVDTQKYHPVSSSEKEHLRARLDIPATATVFSFLGGISERKGVDLLVKAFLACCEERDNLFMVLIGPYDKHDSDYTRQLLGEIRDRGAGKIKLTGFVSNAHEYLQASDLYVLPSYREGFPISVLEALCTGLLVIASRLPEIEDVQISHGDNGFLFQPGSADDLEIKMKEGMCLLKTDPSFVTSAAQNAREKFDIRMVCGMYRQLYGRL